MWHLESMENLVIILGDFSPERKYGNSYKVLFGHFVQNSLFWAWVTFSKIVSHIAEQQWALIDCLFYFRF